MVIALMEDRVPEWHWRAACHNYDPEIFFPSRRTTVKTKTKAKAICASCPVKEQCLDDTLEYESQHGLLNSGIYAGLDPEERRLLRRCKLPDCKELAQKFKNYCSDEHKTEAALERTRKWREENNWRAQDLKRSSRAKAAEESDPEDEQWERY